MAKGNLPKGLSGILGSSATDRLQGLIDNGVQRGSSGGFTSGGEPLNQLLGDLLKDVGVKPSTADKVQKAVAEAAARFIPTVGDKAGSDSATSSLTAKGKAGPTSEPVFSGIDKIVVPGTSGADNLVGTAGVDTIFGGSGGDQISGLGESDSLYGGSGGDNVTGGLGNDTIEGGLGDDALSGDSGNDYIYDGGASEQPITGEVKVSVPVGTAQDALNHTDELAYSTPLAGGGYVTVWGQGIGSSNANTQGIRFQRFDSDGNPVGNQVWVDNVVGDPRLGPFEDKTEHKVLALPDGRFIVIFQSELQGAGPDDSVFNKAFMAVFSASGVYVANSLTDLPTSNDPRGEQSQSAPSITLTTDGTILVAWQEEVRDQDATPPLGQHLPILETHVYIQEYTIGPSGPLNPVGPKQEVPLVTAQHDVQPELVNLAPNIVLIAYNSGSRDVSQTTGEIPVHGEQTIDSDINTDDSSYNVYFRLYNTSTNSFVTDISSVAGTQGEIQVSSGSGSQNNYIFNKSVSVLPNGNFVVTWTSDSLVGGGATGNSTVLFRVYSYNSGTGQLTALGAGPTRVSDVNDTTRPEMDASVTHLADGGFLLLWTRDNTATNNSEVFARRYKADGTAVGAEFQINTTAIDDQRRPTATTLANGNVIISWDSGRNPAEQPGTQNWEDVYQRIIKFGGNGGNDVMSGGSGVDLIFGESGNDQLSGGLLNDSLAGGTGNDTLDGGSGADLLSGGLGEDWANYSAAAGSAVTIDLNLATAQTGTGSEGIGDVLASIEHVFGTTNSLVGDTLLGSDGFGNSLVGLAGNDTLAGRGGDDKLFGGAGDDSLVGGVGADSLQGNENNDALNGGDDVDQLQGNDGDDTLIGGAGGDALDGGANQDTADYTASTAVNITMANATQVGGDAQGDSLANIEIIRGGVGNDQIRGIAGSQTFFGNDGNDSLSGLAGNDTVFGGNADDLLVDGGVAENVADKFEGDAGSDTVSYIDATGVGVQLNLATGGTGGAAQGDLYSLVEHVVGSQLADIITGDVNGNSLVGLAGIDSLNGGAGNDFLFGGDDADVLFKGVQAGNDRFEGDAGNDVVSYAGIADTVTANLTTNVGSGSGFSDIYVAVESLVGGLAGDLLTGNASAGNGLFGLAGNDRIAGLGGADFLDGGDDKDTLDYSASTAVNVNLNNATQVGGDAQGDQVTNFEVILGSNQADVIVDDAGDHTLIGNLGADSLAGGAGRDALFGGDDNDTLYSGAANDLVDGGAGTGDWAAYTGSAAVTVDMTDGALELGGDALNDNLTNIENLLGSSNADILRGSHTVGGSSADSTIFVSNVLVGAAGNDLLLWSRGGDRLDGGADIDTASYDGAGIGILVDLTNGTQHFISGGDPDDVLTGIENVIGTTGNDVLRGSIGTNSLYGGLADDTLEGRDGADRLDGGDGKDWADYRDSALGVTVTLGLQTQVSAGDASGDVLTFIEAVFGSNNSDLTDTLSSILEGSTLDGRDGNDLMVGNEHVAHYYGGQGDEFGDGSDAVDYRASNAAVTVNIDTAAYGGSAAGTGQGGHATSDTYNSINNVLGSALADSIFSGIGTNTLMGFNGNDWLTSRSGVDSLIGGSGSDTLYGGSGGDSLLGGSGLDDIASYTLSTDGVNINLTLLGAQLTGGDGTGDVLNGVEHLAGSLFDDRLQGNNVVNRIYGDVGDDVLAAIANGNGSVSSGTLGDSLYGGDGADILSSGIRPVTDPKFTASDSLYGGDGDDLVTYDSMDDKIIGGTGLDVLDATKGADLIQMNDAKWHQGAAFASFESIHLNLGNDYFLGSSAADDFAQLGGRVDPMSGDTLFGIEVYGGSGSDYISMRGNNATVGIDDLLDGGSGNDNLWGGNGADDIRGGAGNDNMYGGFGDDTIAGNDTAGISDQPDFDVTYFGRNEGNDYIVDSDGLVLFWGNDAAPGTFDGVDPSEVLLTYNDVDQTVVITFTDGSTGSVTFNYGSVELINLFDYRDQSEGHSAPPPTGVRDIWSARWDDVADRFTAWTKVVEAA